MNKLMTPQEMEAVRNNSIEVIEAIKVAPTPEKKSLEIPPSINFFTRLVVAGKEIFKDFKQFYGDQKTISTETSAVLLEGAKAMGRLGVDEANAVVEALPAIMALAATEGAATPELIAPLVTPVRKIISSSRENMPAIWKTYVGALKYSFQTAGNIIRTDFNIVKDAVGIFTKPPMPIARQPI